MLKRKPAFGLVDLIGLIVIAAAVLAIGLPSAGRAREMSKRSVCAVNLKGIGEASRIYAQGHNGQWMTPAFHEQSIDNEGIDYLGWYLPETTDPGTIGYKRAEPSNGGSTALSTTRAFWMLVRSGDVHPKQFICPSSEDTTDGTESTGLYYDFTNWTHISYGYQVPYGPANTRAREDADPDQVFAADKGPFFLGFAPWSLRNWAGATLSSPPSHWKFYNSRNHRNGSDKTWTGEGQNCLFADGRVAFERRPIAGVDRDNIYTVVNPWSSTGLIHGDAPFEVFPPLYPGAAWPENSTTDSFIYP